MPVIFLLKITVITQFNLTLYMHVYSHILDRSRFKAHFIPFMHHKPTEKWNYKPKSFFSFFYYSASHPITMTSLSLQLFEEEITAEASAELSVQFAEIRVPAKLGQS